MLQKNGRMSGPERVQALGARQTVQTCVLCFTFLFAMALLFAQVPAWGQDQPEQFFTEDQFGEEIPRGETVRSRERPEVDPIAIGAGGFLFLPALRQGLEFNDNVFATEDNTKSDFIYMLQPSILVRSDWTAHRLFFDFGGDIGFYFDESDENYQDFYGRTGGTVEITSRNAIRINLGGRRGHEERDDPNDAGGIEPTIFRSYDGGLQYVHRFNRLSLAGGATVQRLDFDDNEAPGGGNINNDDRDRMVYRPGLRVAYEILRDYAAFVRGEGVFVRYDDATDDGGFERDSQGFDIVAGASLDITGLLFGDIFGGYRKRYFDDSRFETVEGPVFGATLTWIPTRLTTVILRVNNEVMETTTDQASAFTSSGVSLGVDHELLRNLILGAAVGYRFDDYDGVPREESRFAGRVSVDYLMNRYVRLEGRYRHELRDSNIAGDDFSRNSVMVFMTLTP